MEAERIKEVKQMLVDLRRKTDKTALKYENEPLGSITEELEQIAIDAGNAVSMTLAVIRQLEDENKRLENHQ